jgi:uncharacterized protein (DUF2141 family)
MKMMTKLCAALGLCLALTTPAFAGDVTISLSGVKAQKGDLYVSMQTKDEFLQPRGSYGDIVKVPGDGAQRIVLKNVAPGDYSVTVWHDSDGDKAFSCAANGVPLDGWTMNNAQALKDRPKWDEVKFSVPAEGQPLSLAMIYPN